MRRSLAMLLVAGCVSTTNLVAQGGPPGGRGAGAQPPRTARAAAPVDLTGQWVSVISEDWRWRMVTPLKGDFANIPLNAEGRKVGLAWDPAKDEASGEACKAYGAPAIMRVPGRVRISWRDDETLQIETDAGTQTRLLHFRSAPPPPERTWQGHSMARWEEPARGVSPAAPFGLGLSPRAGARGRSLEVVTTALRPGYLRKNGVPYSGEATVTEYYDLFREPAGSEWFVVTTIVRDPQYLVGPWVTSSNFKKEADAARWSPSACSAR